MRNLLAHLWQERQYLDGQIERIDAAIEEVAASDAACQRLRKSPAWGRWFPPQR
jgi:transposase